MRKTIAAAVCATALAVPFIDSSPALAGGGMNGTMTRQEWGSIIIDPPGEMKPEVNAACDCDGVLKHTYPGWYPNGDDMKYYEYQEANGLIAAVEYRLWSNGDLHSTDKIWCENTTPINCFYG